MSDPRTPGYPPLPDLSEKQRAVLADIRDRCRRQGTSAREHEDHGARVSLTEVFGNEAEQQTAIGIPVQS